MYHRQTSMKAFTLIEALIATILVGFSIAALVAANGTLTMANGAGTDQSTAEFLAEQIRELTAAMPVIEKGVTTPTIFGPENGETNPTLYDDLDDFDGAVISPPIGVNKTYLAEFASFSQQVTVQNVNPANLDQVVADHGSLFVRVTVHVVQNGRNLCSVSWLRARY